MESNEAAPLERTKEPLLRVDGLVKDYPVGGTFRRGRGVIRAVDGVSFDIQAGETLGLVGESGCGKSTLGKTLLRLIEPTAGHAYFRGTDLFAATSREMRALRRRIQIIFQDPFSSLDPRMSVEAIISESWTNFGDLVPKEERPQQVRDLLARVGLRPDDADRFPHQFSGGQRQRIGIARALAVEPELIVCDEPVSALDVSVQAQVINLLQDLQEEFGLAYLFIAHDLSVVRHICDRIAVMYLGRIVEIGTESEVYENPTHPYTQALLSAVPVTDPDAVDRHQRIVLVGEVPSPADPPQGCHFHTRCPIAQPYCTEVSPELVDQFGHGHPSACHYASPKSVLA